MSDIFYLAPSIAIDDKLPYKAGGGIETRLCSFDPSHASEQWWARPLHVQGPVVPRTDFEWTVYGDLIVSTQTAHNLREAEFSGMLFFDVEFFSTTNTPFGRDSLELKVSGWGGVASQKSGIRLIDECKGCGNQIYSEYTNKEKVFDIDAWDGSDFFIIWPLRRYIMITQAVAEYIQKAGYSGVKVKTLSELPTAVAGSFSPGSLASWRNEIANLSRVAIGL